MALTDKDLREAISKLQERNAQTATTERMSLADFKKSYIQPSINADAFNEQSSKLLEAQEEIASSVTDSSGDGINANASKIVDGIKKTNEGITQLGNIFRTQTKEQSDAISELANNVEITLSPLEKVTQFFSKTKESFSLKNIKETVLGGGARMFKGVPLLGNALQRAKEKESWIKTQMKVDPTLTRTQLSKEWGGYKESLKSVKSSSKEYEDTRKMLGMSDSAFAKTPVGKKLMGKQIAATKEFARFERRASYVAGEEEGNDSNETRRSVDRSGSDKSVNATRKNADATAVAEQESEGKKSFEEQTDLLKNIADNTNPNGEKQPSKVSGGGGLGGMMSSLGKMGAAGGSIVGLLFKGALGVAALGASLLVASVGFKAFADIDWETMAKAGVAVTGLAIAAGTIGSFAGPIALGSLVIAGMGAAVWVLGEALQAVGESVGMFVESIQSLGDIDGGNLIEVGAGLAAVAAGIVAFGAANAVAGVTNLVSGFLGAITPGKTPVEQLLEIANAGPNIQAAGTGIQSFAEGLTKFSAVDKDKLKLISDLPNDKIIALGEAIGKVQPSGANAVYGASAENAGAAAIAGGGNTNNTVVAPTTVTNNTTNSYKPDVRNQDSSFKRMLDNRYVSV